MSGEAIQALGDRTFRYLDEGRGRGAALTDLVNLVDQGWEPSALLAWLDHFDEHAANAAFVFSEANPARVEHLIADLSRVGPHPDAKVRGGLLDALLRQPPTLDRDVAILAALRDPVASIAKGAARDLLHWGRERTEQALRGLGAAIADGTRAVGCEQVSGDAGTEDANVGIGAAYVVELRVDSGDSAGGRFALWFEVDSAHNAVATSGGRLHWATDEASIREHARLVLGAGWAVSSDPVATCDVATLLRACAYPEDAERGLLTTIDLLDDIRETADGLNAAFLDPSAGLPARRVHDEIRNALFDGDSWPTALQRAGGAECVAQATLEMLGRVALAS